jgi:HEPN domain-containing protein
MKKEVDEWLKYAEHDITTVSLIISDPALTQIMAFHCQQAVEKCLKAYLLENSKPIIKTHDLIKLYAMTKAVKDLGIDEIKLKAVNEVYVETRYPSDMGLLPNGIPTIEEVQKFFEFAQNVEKIIKKEMM